MAKVEMDYKKLSITKMLNWLEESKKPNSEIVEFAKHAIVINNDGEKKEDFKKAREYFYNQYKDEINFINIPNSKPRRESTLARLSKYMELLNK